MAECIKEAAREVLEVSKGYNGGRKETGGGMERSKERRGEAVQTSQGERERERKAHDLDQVKCIKDEEGRVLLDEAHICRRWKTYFHSLLNMDGNRDIILDDLGSSESRCDFGYCRRIRIEEVVGALRKMTRGRVTGPDEIPVEFWKSVGREGLEWLTRLFNVIFRTKKMLEEWRWSTMVPLYKNKVDIKNCNNYRGIKLLSHTMKVWERVVELRVRRRVSIFEN
ncbi:PREDICTED: uncharacterized protein LOC109242299 [Nicotiana attenuata]|uniref:uncharacterized protein LOC109242299 n=1 Tax=Nicotiana attenuata TaxID=49451 RepID=UPI0009048172|nr:PREDICTED: uncharacterized protein LOC109242299 [Nicotiana attenuata]